MPLPAANERTHIHTRTIHCEGYKRDDGLWDIEAHLKDVRTFSVESDYRNRIEAGEPIHEMSLRVTLDVTFVIHDLIAVSDHVPAEPCTRVPEGMRSLIGLRIAPGWMKQVRERVGGVQGCTHLIELLRPIGTTAYQTMFREVGEHQRNQARITKPGVIDSCISWAADGEKVKKHWPEFYQGE